MVRGFPLTNDDCSDEPDGESEVDGAILADIDPAKEDESGADKGENDTNGPAVMLSAVGFATELAGLEGICTCVEGFQA